MDTSSSSAESRSATSAMPTGAAQPPSGATIGPVPSLTTSSTPAMADTASSTTMPTTRCSVGERLPMTVTAAPSRGSSTGSASSQA